MCDVHIYDNNRMFQIRFRKHRKMLISHVNQNEVSYFVYRSKFFGTMFFKVVPASEFVEEVPVEITNKYKPFYRGIKIIKYKSFMENKLCTNMKITTEKLYECYREKLCQSTQNTSTG